LTRITRPNAAIIAPIEITVSTVAAIAPSLSPRAAPRIPTPTPAPTISAAAMRGGSSIPVAAAT
jgi:hypothetical protein